MNRPIVFQNIIIKTDKHFLNKYKETIEKDSFSKLKETTTAYSLCAVKAFEKKSNS